MELILNRLRGKKDDNVEVRLKGTQQIPKGGRGNAHLPFILFNFTAASHIAGELGQVLRVEGPPVYLYDVLLVEARKTGIQ